MLLDFEQPSVLFVVQILVLDQKVLAQTHLQLHAWDDLGIDELLGQLVDVLVELAIVSVFKVQRGGLLVVADIYVKPCEI